MAKHRTVKNYSIRVDTTVFDNGDVQVEEIDELTNQRTIQILKTKDNQVREALIKLGWTPPTSNKHNRIIYHGGCHDCATDQKYCNHCCYKEPNWNLPCLNKALNEKMREYE